MSSKQELTLRVAKGFSVKKAVVLSTVLATLTPACPRGAGRLDLIHESRPYPTAL